MEISVSMNTIKQHIKNNEFKQVYLIYGTETYLKRLYKGKLKEALLVDSDDMNYTYAKGKDIDGKEISLIVETMPFFRDRRLIIIEDSGWFKNASEFAEVIKELPDTTFLIFIESEVDKRNRLFKVVKEIGYVCEMNGMEEKNLKLWVLSLINRDNKKITDETMMYFLNKVGSNMDSIEMELCKLIGYCYGREVITKEDVDAVCSEQITGKMFLMLDAIASKNQTRALKLYYDLLTLREKPMTILYLLNRHINLLMISKDMLGKGKDNKAIAEKLAVPPFAVNKYTQQTRNFKKDMLMKALLLGTELEEQVKTGRLMDQIAVELMIIQVVALS
jgi:DNA polymerase-3 subunit delta